MIKEGKKHNINKINASCASITIATLKGTLIQAERERWRRQVCMSVCAQSLSCVWLCDPRDCRLPGSSVYGIILARILEWVTISSSRESSWRRDRTRVSCVSWIGRYQGSKINEQIIRLRVVSPEDAEPCLAPRTLPSTIGDVIWRSLKMYVFVNLNKSKMTNKESKGHNTLPAFSPWWFLSTRTQGSIHFQIARTWLISLSLCPQQLTE